ncbi:ankyrin repeat protein [Salinibacter ruber]|uniref:ankyrin repeat domain-containing protein n=1 Tax=Salinibacter ruber TaxID=146919 RepID=UPI00216806CD|nr:ankyrin repeat protein [Salinibacter ruber]MCS3642349.1 ankyrin repeat protein [Salinibacter ruber]MCS3715425.1 ankyrin repeat protein [Salinibacter ruber]
MSETQENPSDRELEAALVDNARDGDADRVRDLLGRGVDPNATFDAQSEADAPPVTGKITALIFASWAGHTEIAEALLEAGAEPGLGSLNGKTPLAAAAGKGHSGIVEALLEAGADLSASTERVGPPLGFAVHGGDRKSIELLLGAGADPNCRVTDQNYTLLSYTAVEDEPQLTELLLEEGADPDLVDSDGLTALAYTALSGAANVAQRLLDAGADPTISPGHRSLPELARDKGNPEVADLLGPSR